jgi:hypothetical protein
LEVEALAADVPGHGRVVGVWARAVSLGKAAGGHGERDVEEDRQIPVVPQFVAVQKQSVEHEDDAGRPTVPRAVFGAVACEVVHLDAVPHCSAGRQWIE